MTETQKTDRILQHFGQNMKQNKRSRVQQQAPTVTSSPLFRLITPILGLIGQFLTILDLLHWLKTCKDAYDLPRRWRQLCKHGMPIIVDSEEGSWVPDHYLPEEFAVQIIQRNVLIPKDLAFIVLRSIDWTVDEYPLFIYRHVLHYRDVSYVETGLRETAYPTLCTALGFEDTAEHCWQGEKQASANLFDSDITPKTIKQCLWMLTDGGKTCPLEPYRLCDCIAACFDLQPLHVHLLLPIFQIIFDKTYAKGHWAGWRTMSNFPIDMPLFMFIQFQQYATPSRVYRHVLARQCLELPLDKLQPFLELFLKVFWHPLSQYLIICGFGDFKRLYQNTEQYTMERFQKVSEIVVDLLPETCAKEVLNQFGVPMAILEKLVAPKEEPEHPVFKDLYEMLHVD